MAADDVEGVVVFDMDGREARHVAYRVDIDAPAIDGQAALTQRRSDEILCRVLGTAHRGKLDELRRQGDLLVEPGIDGIHDGGREF